MTTSSQTFLPAFTAPDPGRASEQAPVFEALMALAAEFAELPRPYIVVQTTGCWFTVQLMHPSHFEAWREALGLPADLVDLVAGGSSVWLASSDRFRGVRFELTGHGVPLTVEQASAPRVADESLVVAA
ncbi:hypothetical protein [Streptomyces antibioticus]|uniref:SseB protein N-terminal domain-containing protein n=1 Tax=Streptomyces antibioticus TaxID=1890 RepID=A0AAE6YEX4_STRAT|nr:hypothetical protein [Streptomyces antibioticus]OOQ47262.1 hypothetical protein AFM16_31430 [Streptomyces antibioticus]QIT47579.1 hypothetical protein HCX60_31980 [Streptomyces antibioticus]